MMLSNQSDIQMVGRLLALLDEQIVLLDNRLAIPKGLSQATANYDNQAMETLLARMEQAMLAQGAHDRALRDVRKRLAAALGWPLGNTCLTALAKVLGDDPRQGPQGLAAQVHSRRSRIIQLVAAIRQTHMHMVLLLTECMKVNRLLMEHLFPQAQGLALYGSSGHKRWRQSPGLVDAEL
jgi:hypothetical protein